MVSAKEKLAEAAKLAKQKAEEAQRAAKRAAAAKRRRQELKGLVSLTDEKPPFFEALSDNFHQKIHDYLYRKYNIIWKPMTRGEYLISRYTDQGGDVVTTFKSLQIEPEDQLNWLEFWAQLGMRRTLSMRHHFSLCAS
jgi:hypothetical protein